MPNHEITMLAVDINDNEGSEYLFKIPYNDHKLIII